MKIKLILFLFPLLVQAQMVDKKFTGKFTKDVEVDYVIHYPDNYKKSKQNYPLILFLHGSGERGKDLSLVSVHGPLKYIQEGNKLDAVVVAPQCPADQIWDHDDLYALIKEVVYQNNIDITRIYLTGLSMGGLGTWDLALAYPELFAAIAPICGPIQFNYPAVAHKIKDIPTWVFHGAKDEVVPITTSEMMVEALKKAGGDPKFTIDPEAGHDSWSKPYSDPDFYRWMFSQQQKLN